jgi:uncharacterized membrane protein YdjX (TVP38/TMEM64 family)
MSPKSFSRKYSILLVAVIVALVFLGYVNRTFLWGRITGFYHIFTDRDQVKVFIASFGSGAPLVFIIIQILQVLLAPFPGEATGFIGGFLFGPAKVCLYSSVGLTLGSLLNFSIGRFLGKHYVRKLIPPHQLERLDRIVKRQGVIVLFVLFVFPGFPKDYLCLFLGLSALPLTVFMVIATIGRMPGTLMLSLQGSYVFEQKYGLFAVIMGVCLIIVFLAYTYRDPLYQWLERFNGNRG